MCQDGKPCAAQELQNVLFPDHVREAWKRLTTAALEGQEGAPFGLRRHKVEGADVWVLTTDPDMSDALHPEPLREVVPNLGDRIMMAQTLQGLVGPQPGFVGFKRSRRLDNGADVWLMTMIVDGGTLVGQTAGELREAIIGYLILPGDALYDGTALAVMFDGVSPPAVEFEDPEALAREMAALNSIDISEFE